MRGWTLNFEEGINALRTHKLRSFLAILGVVIGVAAVIAIVSFGEGNHQRIQEEIDKIGADVFWIQQSGRVAYFTEEDGMVVIQRQIISRHLEYTDGEALKIWGTKIEKVSSHRTVNTEIILNGRQVTVEVTGVEPYYRDIMDMDIIRGRFLTEVDLRENRKVCVIEYSENLRPYLMRKDPLESNVIINNVKYRVIGLLSKMAKGFGSSDRGNVYIPLTTVQYIHDQDYPEMIYCQTESKQIKEAMRQAEEILKSRNRGEPFVQCMNIERFFQSAEALSRTASLITGGIAMISLIVGGIGIMNIMLVSVTERTREIGMRKCVGAKKRDIRNQFLLESVLLTSLGGIVGIGLGIFLAKLIASIINIPVALSLLAIIVGLAFSMGIGIISGFYPAFKGSKLNPIEALRYE